MAELRIKEILKTKGMSVQELADKMGISRQALSRQINGKLLVDTAGKIAFTLGVPLWQFFATPEERAKDEEASIIKDTSIIIECPKCHGKIIYELKK